MAIKTPFCSVDILIEVEDSIVIIERKYPPHGYALPGGFVDIGERVEHAAIREAKEETGLDIELYDFLYVYSDPSRDPRQHNISFVFIARAKGIPQGNDDAKHAFLVPIQDLHKYNFAFDHGRIISDYLRYRKEGIRPNPKDFL